MRLALMRAGTATDGDPHNISYGDRFRVPVEGKSGPNPVEGANRRPTPNSSCNILRWIPRQPNRKRIDLEEMRNTTLAAGGGRTLRSPSSRIYCTTRMR